MQAWADKLAAAEDTEGLCDIIRELYQQEDIPYGGLIFCYRSPPFRIGTPCLMLACLWGISI